MTMKKTYIIPQTEVLTLTPASIIALSDPTLKPNGENITGGLIEEEAGGPGLTKEQPHYNVWDDDWSK